MLALIQETSPGIALLAIAILAGAMLGCRAVAVCWLGLAAIRAARPQDLSEALKAVGQVVDDAVRFRR